ncbi:MAG: type II 3-dehydroquinate dehydratase [Gemmatimonadota bacterium]
MSLRIGVVHGPNLNLLGSREPEHYGHLRLSEIEALLSRRAKRKRVELSFFQSNEEGALVGWVQEHSPSVDGWLVNAAAFTHTSVALRDALAACGRPFVEVHLSNIFARETFRHESLLADLAVGVVAGFRENSYLLGLEALVSHLTASP